MDPSSLFDALTPVAGLGVIMLGLVKIARYWAQGHQARKDLAVNQLQERLDAMEHDLAGLQQELGETRERIDFAERLLAQSREAKRLPDAIE